MCEQKLHLETMQMGNALLLLLVAIWQLTFALYPPDFLTFNSVGQPKFVRIVLFLSIISLITSFYGRFQEKRCWEMNGFGL